MKRLDLGDMALCFINLPFIFPDYNNPLTLLYFSLYDL